MVSRLIRLLLLIACCLVACPVRGLADSESVTLTVTPTALGTQLVRTSLPLPRGLLHENQTLNAHEGRRKVETSVRPLSWQPTKSGEPKSARRVMVTFPYNFKTATPVEFAFGPAAAKKDAAARLPVEVNLDGDQLAVRYRGGPALKVRLLAPARISTDAPRSEVLESNAFYRWERFHLPDSRWPRVIEVRSDALGQVVVVAHLQRNLPDDGRAPDFGWELETTARKASLKQGAGRISVGRKAISHSYTNGAPCSLLFEDGKYSLYHPAAPLKRRGRSEAKTTGDGRLIYRYWRCTADERVPMQPTSWQRAELVIAPAKLASLTATLQSPHQIAANGRAWDELYATGQPLDLKGQPKLAALLRYHHDAIVRSMAVGDDWGNVTSYADGQEHGAVFGMNRLNHCPPIFQEAWRSGDRRLLETALLWCDNFYDQTIWWGETKHGGTRYNNVRAQGRTPPDDDQTYMWRSNDSVHFCTKGYDSFLLAYEATGDPRMLEALDAQTAYAAKYVHVLDETRNVGDVRDFVRLYRYTGDQTHLDQALRLFREYRSVLSTGDLTDQRGKPIEPNPPFIDDDVVGKKHPFAKPYIIGYALAGLPDLIALAPGEPKLRDVVRATADFLAESQDPLGGWRYPHPRSSRVVLGHSALEHAWQLTRSAAVLGPDEKYLNVIERVLRLRILTYQRSGRLPSLLESWEVATDKVKELSELYQLYQYPADRDYFRDYTEGKLTLGISDPEGLVYLPEVLRFYLEHRPASRLLAAASENEPLGKLLARVPESKP